MRTSPETAINDLLLRWHRWSSASARVADTRMADFDAVLVELPAKLRIALQVQAMNLAAGAAVWSSVRAAEIGEARAYLRALLAEDELRWFGPVEVKLNERGNRIGESNPKARLSDHEVTLLLEMREERNADGSRKHTYGWLAEKFEIHWTTVRSICAGRTRGQAAVRVKRVE